MAHTERDPDGFKTRDASSYDAVTESFDRFTERFTTALAEQMVDLAELRGDEHVLDIGTGTAVVALAAARRLSDDGHVVGADLSQGMLDFAAGKIASAGMDARISLQREDAEELSFPDTTFDAALSLYALLHFPHPDRALAHMQRVLRPGGRLVVAIGRGPPMRSRAGLAYIWRRLPLVLNVRRGRWLSAPAFLDGLVERHLPGDRAAEESEMHGHGHGVAAERLIRMVAAAGFTDVRTEWAAETDVIESPEDFWELQATFSSMARKRLENAAPADAAALRETFLQRCRDVQARGGRLVYPYAAFFVRATKR